MYVVQGHASEYAAHSLDVFEFKDSTLSPPPFALLGCVRVSFRVRGPCQRVHASPLHQAGLGVALWTLCSCGHEDFGAVGLSLWPPR